MGEGRPHGWSRAASQASLDAQRQVGKSVAYGLVYVMGATGLAQHAGVTHEQARDVLDRFHAAYPDVRRYQRRAQQRALDCGYAEDLFGRRRMLPHLTSASAEQRAAALRAAVNTPISSTAAGLLKRALVTAAPALEQLGAHVTLLNRDEVLLAAPLDRAQAATTVMQRAMECPDALSVPLAVHVGYGMNWRDAKGAAD